MILPIFDRNGREIIAGARVRYCLPDYYINVKSGTGTVVSTDEYGGVYYDADKPEPALLFCLIVPGLLLLSIPDINLIRKSVSCC